MRHGASMARVAGELSPQGRRCGGVEGGAAGPTMVGGGATQAGSSRRAAGRRRSDRSVACVCGRFGRDRLGGVDGS